MNKIKILTGKIALIMFIFPWSNVVSQEPQVNVAKLSESVYMISGQGGNVGLSVGDDGAFLIDDELESIAPRLLESIREITKQPVQFVVNTHWHFDHTGGNELLGKAGSTIVAHRNVRKRMQSGQLVPAFNMDFPPAHQKALPVITFEEGISFHLNNDEMVVESVSPAHTDGDAIVFFKQSNIVHMGDVYWNGLYPLVDASSGGSMQGMVDAVTYVLNKIDADTKIIPGHGAISNKSELESYYKMLSTTLKNVQELKSMGKTLDEIIAAKPTAEFDPAWGKGLFTPDQWVGVVYSAL